MLVKYAKDIGHYYIWNSSIHKGDKKEYESWIARQKGAGGTSPHLVAKTVVEQRHKSVILITDGQVGDHEVKQCDQILEGAMGKFRIQRAVCFVLGQYSEPNLSVTCPFTRYSESRVFSKAGPNPLREQISFTASDYKVLDELEEISLESFEAKYETIEQLVIAVNMGKESNPQLKNQLVSTKTRLVKELSKKLGKKSDSEMIRAQLEGQNFGAAMELVKAMGQKYFEEAADNSLEKRLNYLISLCGDMRGKYSLGEIKSNKMVTATVAQEGKLDETVELGKLSKNLIECPIILDEDVPQILIDECEPLLLGLEKGFVDDINACPLRILNYPNLRSKLKSKLSTFTGTKYSDKLLKNPFTQNRLLGAIPLGTHRSHVTVGNHTIAKLISGGKVMGNLNMWLAAIWILVKEGEVEYLKPVQANLEEHLLHRLRTTNTMASMCGLSQFVSTQVSSDIALWYCLSSGFLSQPPEKDTFRFHLFDIPHMLKVNELLGYPLHEGFTRHHQRTLALFQMLDKWKRSSVSQRKALKTLARGLHQRGFFVETKGFKPRFVKNEVVTCFVPVDGKPEPEQVQEVKRRLLKEAEHMRADDLHYVLGLMDDAKLFSDIVLDYNLTVPTLPEPEQNWPYGTVEVEHTVTIDPVTLRPVSRVDGKPWEKQAADTFGLADPRKLFKGCRYIEEFLLRYKWLPTPEELSVFYYNRYVEAGKVSTLPFQTEQWARQLLESYRAVVKPEADMGEVVAALKASKGRERRQELECH